MDEHSARSAAQAREHIIAGTHDRRAFRAALLAVPPRMRDAWLDRVLDLQSPPDDGPQLPRGCVPYLPCTVDALIELVDRAEVVANDIFVDIGSGVGRAMALVHLLTDAPTLGVEIQSQLVDAAREIARVTSPRISTVEGDAVEVTRSITNGTVFFLYCPFSGERLHHLLANLEAIAKTRPIRVCCVDLPLPPCTWLAADDDAAPNTRVAIYRSAHIDHIAAAAT